MKFTIPDAVRVAFFDMDHTLIDNDCDLSWKFFLADRGLAGWTDRVRGRWHFFLYRIGRLNPEKFMRFQLAQFRGRTAEEMQPLFDEHFREYVLPRLYPDVPDLLAAFAARGIPRIMVTATNGLIAGPLARHLGFEEILATDLEKGPDNRFTGRVGTTYCLGERKLDLMAPAAAELGLSLGEAMYWGDSGNDVPVLAAVGHPVAVNPAPALRSEAKRRGWTILDLSPR